MKIFCISIFNKNYREFKNLNLLPVGLGKEKFDKNWLTDKGLKNISNKNLNFGEYTFHYKLWKNSSLIKHYNDWIGFCSYRRFWTISNKRNVNSFNELKKIKLIKRNLFEVIKKPSMLINHNTLEDQFRVFHGSFFLDTAIELLPKNYQIDFKNFLKKKKFYPYNIFICKK